MMLPFWAETLNNPSFGLMWVKLWQSFWLPKCQPGGCTQNLRKMWNESAVPSSNLFSFLLSEDDSPSTCLISKCVFPMGKKNPSHLEMFNWLWERIHVQERIQKGGHKCALWILGKAERRRVQAVSFSLQLPRAVQGLKKISSHSTTERSRKVSMVPKLRGWQRNQQNKKKGKKKSVAIFPNNSRNTNMVL